MLFGVSDTLEDVDLMNYIHSLVQERLAVALALGAVEPTKRGYVYVLVGADDAIRVTGPDRSQLIFCHPSGPGCEIVVRDDHVGMSHDADTVVDVAAKIELLRTLAVGLPERAMYGWVEGDIISALIMAGEVAIRDGIAMPPGLTCYVLQGQSLPAPLRMSAQPSNSDVSQWYEQFWQLVQEGRIMNVAERFRQFPGEVWLTCKDGEAWIHFDAGDGLSPGFVEAHPYIHWQPREEFPGQHGPVKWPDAMYSMNRSSR